MNKLIIDTADNKRTTIKIIFGESSDVLERESKPRSQTALIMIDEILKKNDLIPEDLDSIEVNCGPGSFTGTRVGVAIANAFGFGLKIKVNGKPLVEPKYN